MAGISGLSEERCGGLEDDAAANETDDEADAADAEFEALADADGLVASLTLTAEAASTGDFAAIHLEPDADALEDLLGRSADERTVAIDGERVTATGTWHDDDDAD